MTEYTISPRAMELREFLFGQMSAKEEERAAMAVDPITSNSRDLRGAEFDPLKLQAVDPRIEVVNQPIREPQPEPEPGPGLEPEEAPGPSSNGVERDHKVEHDFEYTLPGLSGIGECNCTYRRALEYLMEQVPDLRDAVENFFALEKSVARLQGSAPHAPESARRKGPR